MGPLFDPRVEFRRVSRALIWTDINLRSFESLRGVVIEKKFLLLYFVFILFFKFESIIIFNTFIVASRPVLISFFSYLVIITG